MNDIGAAVYLILALAVGVGISTAFSKPRPKFTRAKPKISEAHPVVLRGAPKASQARARVPNAPCKLEAKSVFTRSRSQLSALAEIAQTVRQKTPTVEPENALPWVIPTALAPNEPTDEIKNGLPTIGEMSKRIEILESRLRIAESALQITLRAAQSQHSS